jgi:hypothetical protein
MKRFINQQNLAHYKKLLLETTDPAKRQVLLRLLADEQEQAASQGDFNSSLARVDGDQLRPLPPTNVGAVTRFAKRLPC